jgi:hypothetical protein
MNKVQAGSKSESATTERELIKEMLIHVAHI